MSVRHAIGLLALALAGCGPPGGSQIGDRDRTGPDADTGRPAAADSDAPDVPYDSGTTDSGTTDTGEFVDCSVLPPVPETWISTQFVTEEDFDLDPRGFLLAQNGSNLVGVKSDGTVRIFAAGLVGDIAGIRVMSTGQIAVAQPSLGGISVVEADGKGYVSVFTDIQSPNALAVDTAGRVYIPAWTGHVEMVDPATLERWTVTEGAEGLNGIALSPDEQTVYLSGVDPFDGTPIIVSVARLTDTTFAAPRVFAELPRGDNYFTIATDVCGNVYTVAYRSGRVIRIAADGSFMGTLIEIGIEGSYSGMRFGNGVDVFGRRTLFLTRRAAVYGIDAGIPGRPPVVMP